MQNIELRNNLLEESKRCLKCRNHPCKNACPIGTEIPYIIGLFQENKIEEAGEKLFENNPLSLICSLICPFENQCMGNCVRGIKGKAVDFPQIENFIMQKYLENISFTNIKSNGIKVGIIGAGPAGISAAFYLRKKGYEITIYDDHEKMGGMLRYGIPSFRLAKDKIDLLEEKIYEVGIKFEGNRKFDEKSLKTLKDNNKYDAVLVATGAWLPKEIDLEGVERENIFYGIDYLKHNIKLGKDKNVVVIGAGNVAMDVARIAKREGNNVTIAYRKKLEVAPATTNEIEEAKKDGVNFITEVTPVKITDNGIILENTNDKKSFLYKCDNVIIAISQKSEFDKENLEGYFYGGDLVTGPQTVATATFSGKKGAKLLHSYIKERELL